MAIVREILTDALAEIGAYAQGETIEAPDIQFALRRFQMQIDAWNALEVNLAVNRREVFTLTGGTSTVTIGATGATVTAPRPTFFTGVNYVIIGSSPEVEVPMGQLDDDSYANLSIKTLTSTYPTQWYWNATTPNGTLIFWPVPVDDVDIVLYYSQSMTEPVTINDTMVGPPGYQEAFMYQLALRLCTPFGRQIPEGLPQLAADAYARMQRPNLQPGLLGVDAALVPTYGGAYNVLSDMMTGSNGR